MNIKGYLVVSKRGRVRFTKGKTALGYDEVSIALTAVLPEALFNKPRIEATVTIPDSAAQPKQITAEVEANCKTAIEQATGMEVVLRVVQAEELKEASP